ncbi:unnamed protein product, partial [Didymodactylos carnosus]
ITATGFRLPTSKHRTQEDGKEGQFKFGLGIYFAHGKKATEYGHNVLILTDCVLGRVREMKASDTDLTAQKMHESSYDTVYFKNDESGLVNQEWTVYRSEQCLPLCIIDYDIIDESDTNEKRIIDSILQMDVCEPDHALLKQAVRGTDNQCKAALQYIGDVARILQPFAIIMLRQLLTSIGHTKVHELLKHQNDTIRILFLRALWVTGRHDESSQKFFHSVININILIESLNSTYVDIAWRACGVIANLASCVVDIRRLLTFDSVINQLLGLLKRGMQNTDKLCIITVLNLFANITCSEYKSMKEKQQLLISIDPLTDHHDEMIQEAANRFFCNIIGKGTVTPDWTKAGYKDTMMAPDLE